MILVQGEKYACLNCIRGHRSSTCDHTNRPLVQVRRRGRPNHACQHRLAVIAEPTCSCGMTAVLVPEHSAAGIKEEDKKPGSAGAKKNTKSVGIIRIGAHSKKIIDTSNGKVTVLDTPVNQFLKENPSGNCTCAASGLEPEEYFDRLKQKSSCCSKEEKPASNGCCSGNKPAAVKKEEPSHTHISSPLNPNVQQPVQTNLPGVNALYQGQTNGNGHAQGGHAQGHAQGQNGQGQAQNGAPYAYNSYYQSPYMYNSSYYAGHTVQVQSERAPIPGQVQGVQQQVQQVQQQQGQVQPQIQVVQPVQGQVQSQEMGQNQMPTSGHIPSPPVQGLPGQQPETPYPQINGETLFGQIDPSFSQMWKGESPQQPVAAQDSGPEDRLTPEEFFDMYFAPTCSIPGQCGCGEGCQCKGCPTHDSQTELEGAPSGERFTWE